MHASVYGCDNLSKGFLPCCIPDLHKRAFALYASQPASTFWRNMPLLPVQGLQVQQEGRRNNTQSSALVPNMLI